MEIFCNLLEINVQLAINAKYQQKDFDFTYFNKINSFALNFKIHLLLYQSLNIVSFNDLLNSLIRNAFKASVLGYNNLMKQTLNCDFDSYQTESINEIKKTVLNEQDC